VKSPAWAGDHWQSAGEYYSSGTYHGSWDIAMPSGTKLFAPVACKVLDRVTGVPNVPGGSGSPSNWVTLGFQRLDGSKVSLYFQHCKSIVVKPGQKLQPGDLIGYSGNSGNSSGPHLHLTFQNGWRYAWDRYAYLDNNSGIYPPSKSWEMVTLPLSNDDAKKVAKAVWDHKIDTKDLSGKPIKKAASWLQQNVWLKVR
jgi:murein DD-endopeptidase MepM/ murein hydrolase activator NlpD